MHVKLKRTRNKASCPLQSKLQQLSGLDFWTENFSFNMEKDGMFFIGPDGSSSGFFLMDPLIPRITSFVDNSRYLCMPGSLALQEAFSCMSKIAGAVVIWLCRGSNFNANHRVPGNNFHSHSSCSNILTRAKHVPSLKCDLPGFFTTSKGRRKSSNSNPNPFVGKISRFALKHLWKKVEWLQSFPVLTAALVPPFSNMASNIPVTPVESGSVEQPRSMDQRSHEIETQGCGPYTDRHLQSLAWSKTIEPGTGIELPTLLDNSISGESSSIFTPEMFTLLMSVRNWGQSMVAFQRMICTSTMIFTEIC